LVHAQHTRPHARSREPSALPALTSASRRPARRKPHRKPLSQSFFSHPPAAGAGAPANEQFFTFVSLAAWLLQACGAQVANPKEFDDPNATLAALLSAARALGGAPAAAAAAGGGGVAARLAAGWGPEVCEVLDGLAGAALDKRGFRFAAPVYSAGGRCVGRAQP
jgi:estrogen-related receptor beta like 1